VNSLLHAMNAASAGWWDALARAAWQGALALALVWIVSRCITAIPAAYKVWLWRLAFIKLLLALVWITPISLAVLPLRQETPLSMASSASIEVPLVVTAQAAPFAGPLAEAAPTLDWRAWLFVLWCLGVVGGMARLLQQWRTARILIQNSEPITGAALDEMVARLSHALRLRRRPLLFQSSTVCSPLLLGFFRPRIILPSITLSTHTGPQLEMVLAHELAHVRRCDLCWLWLFTFAEILFFFHPLIWLTRREWSVATESACDQLALHITGRAPHDYGSMLVAVVARLRRRSVPAVMSLGMMETATTLKRRLKAMTAKRTWFYTAVGIATVSIATLAVAPYQLVAQTPDAETLARLKEENARLKQQLEATRSEIEAMRESMAAKKQEESLKKHQQHAETAQSLEHAERELDVLTRKYTDTHPDVIAKRKEVEKLRTQLQRQLELPRSIDVSGPRVGVAERFVPATQEQMERSREQRELLAREIELAQQQVEVVHKKLENGKEVPESLLRVQREVLDLKLKQAEASGSNAERRAVLLQQLQIAERLLKDQKKRIEVGTTAPGEEIAFEREVLRLKRELAGLP